MSLLERINECSYEDINRIIDTELEKITRGCKKEKIIEFGENMGKVTVHKGFIHPDTRIRYSNYSMNSYSMKSKDFYYEFAKFVKDYHIKNKDDLVRYLESFINSYFGINRDGKDRRDDYFDSLAWNSTSSDEEYFKAIDNFEIGTLKHQNIAMCTDRAAMAENLLSLFGIDVLYCVGSITNENSECHAFNIGTGKNNYILLDYSLPVPVYKNDKLSFYVPFQGNISNDEIDDVLNNKKVLSFNNYYYIYDDGKIKKVIEDSYREYVVGEFLMDNHKDKK